MNRAIYKEIRKVMPYQMCKKEILAHLSSEFTYEQFEYVFLLAFSSEKKDLILKLGTKDFRKWLRNYYLTRVAYKYKPSISFKGTPQKWVARFPVCSKYAR